MCFDAFNVLNVHVNKEETDLVIISQTFKVKPNKKIVFVLNFILATTLEFYS